MGGGKKTPCAVTGYLKLLLFVYIVTSPFLLEKSGVTDDDGKKAVASAAACLLGALGLGIIVYDRDQDASARALGALLILTWLSTVIVIWRHGSASSKGRADGPGASPTSALSRTTSLSPGPWLVEGLAVADEGDNADPRATADPRYPPDPRATADLPVSADPRYPPDPRATADLPVSADPRAGGDHFPKGSGSLPRGPLPEWASADEIAREGLGPDDLGRIFSAPNLKDFMNPSPTGFVTPSDLAEIQSGGFGDSDTALKAIVPLGKGSYSAQGVMLGSEVCGTV